MKANQISILFNSLGICPNFKGYPYLSYIVEIAVSYHGKPFPTLKALYSIAGEHFDVSPSIISHDIRTLLRVYWNQDNSDTFAQIIHYPVRDKLTIKEFVSVVAEYIATQT